MHRLLQFFNTDVLYIHVHVFTRQFNSLTAINVLSHVNIQIFFHTLFIIPQSLKLVAHLKRSFKNGNLIFKLINTKQESNLKWYIVFHEDCKKCNMERGV